MDFRGVSVGWLGDLRLASAAGAAVLIAASSTTGVAAAPAARPAPTALYVVALDPDVPTHTVLRKVGSPQVLYRFGSALNGFAALLTRVQVKQLDLDPDVALVERSTKHRLDAADSTRYLGVEDAWAATGGPDGAGRGKVVGVVDSGIWPENPSFAALPGYASKGPSGFTGTCQRGEQWDRSDCNSKVVGARWFVKGFGADNLAASEYLSPRDVSGHGSHTAAVAAGNDDVRVKVDGQAFGRTSGMAPGARIAVYKACWTAPQPVDDGCTTADAVAAIDGAVADGVDVISYAVSGPRGDSEAVDLALLNATAAGVFVAASAGGRGPRTGSVSNQSPWVTTVAASTHRTHAGAVVLGGRRYVGGMVSDQAVRPSRIVLAEQAATPGSSREDARLCRPGALDGTEVAGRIVVCDRGRVARVQKSAAVARAGGVGMVLADVRPDTGAADFHAVPTVHLDVEAADDLKRRVRAAARPTASLDPGAPDGPDAPQVARFSSRGPARGGTGGILLKPDVSAPGVAVMSAVAPPHHDGRRWDLYSGTSMSTAHVAGLAALVTGERPRWTPAMVKSAIVTTARRIEESGPLAAGAGLVDPAGALDPGLVLDAPTRRFRGWLAGDVPTRNLNLPSITVGALTGRTRVVRHATNVSGKTETYNADVQGLAGLDVRVRPASLRLRPGETGSFAVVVGRRAARPGTSVLGSVLWSSPDHQVRLPVVVVPRSLSVPHEVAGSVERGALSVQGVPGADGELEPAVAGLVAARPLGVTLEPGSFDPTAPRADADTLSVPIDVPSGTDVLRVELKGRATDDLDLHLYRGGRLVASATGSEAEEVLTVPDPEAGPHDLYVTSVVAANRSTTTAQLYTWILPRDDAGNLRTRHRLQLRTGEPFALRLRWGELDPTARWFGVLRYGAGSARTFVTLT